MSRTIPPDDDVVNPKIAAACFDFLLIELVPMAYRIANELSAREEALMTTASRQHLYGTSSTHPGPSTPGNTNTATTKTLPDRTSQISSGDGGAKSTITATGTEGASTTMRPMGGVGGAGEDEEDESVRENVFFRLDMLGYRVGQGLAERFSADQPRPSSQLDCIKFVCKDIWTRVFRKQIDNLKTNHRGTFVLTDSRFQPLHRISADRKLGPRGVDQAVAKAQAFLWFPCGLIRGALAGLGMNVTVHAESTDLPVATFQIRSVGAKP